MIIVQILIAIQLTNTLVLCSLVIDEHDSSQQGLHITDYCPEIGVCKEGSHVMCLYYNPDRVMGPTCHSVVNISITPEYALTFLNVINKIRSRIAKGTLKGKDDMVLPKGYGIYKLEWDEELATFAQLWANQCVLKSDLCHATRVGICRSCAVCEQEQFPDPGQTLGMIRFTIDDWQPINSPDFSNSTTLTPDKVKYAILTILEAWYNLKKLISVDNIKKLDSRVNQFPYLVYGKVTHIGCGLSAYREYAYQNDKAEVYYNSIQIVCNFSSRAQKGIPVYDTDPPTEPGYTVKCGCPLGYDEDEDCLCYKSGRKITGLICKDSNRCKPSVVVLPIFQVENAPEHKLSDTTKSYPLNVKSRHFGKVTNINHNHIYDGRSSSTNPKHSKKYSIFSRPPIFELPLRRKNHLNQYHIEYKKDVAPRKDFSKAQRLAFKYIEKKRNFPLYIEKSTENLKIETITPNYYNDTNEFTTKESKKINSDRYLMTLLDKLEVEIKNIDINSNNKDIFDRRIRKIYEFLVGKSNMDYNKDTRLTKSYNDSDIVEKYNKILNNNHLYKERSNKKLYKDVDYTKKLNRNFQYAVTNISDVPRKNSFDDRRKSRRVIKEDFSRKDLRSSRGNEDLFLDVDRRMFYENKLLNLQRKLNLEKRNQHRHAVSVDRRLRPVRPTKVTEGLSYRKAKESMDTFYMPDRARFLHGF